VNCVWIEKKIDSIVYTMTHVCGIV